MPPTDRTGSSVFWPKISSLVDGTLVTMELLYNQAIHRLQDNGVYLLGKIAAVYSDMSSTAIGTRAQVVGNVDLTAFNYNGGITLSGLTLIFDEDTAAAQTVTFDNTVTTPAILLAQIVAQAPTNLTHAFTNDGFLLSKSNTVGSGSTMATVTGTAAALVLGSQTVTSPGSGVDANDGASKIGLGAFASPSGWPGGTLRDFLQMMFTLADANNTGKVAKSGDTMTGDLTMGASAAIKLADRTVTRPLRTPWSFSYDATPEWLTLNTGNPAQQLTVDTNGQVALREIDALTGDVITGVTVWLKFDGSHGTYPPAQFPRIRLVELDTAGTPNYVASADDAPANQAAYEALHSIAITGQSLTVAANKQYRVEIRGENEQTGLQVYDVTVTVTTKGLPPGG